MKEETTLKGRRVGQWLLALAGVLLVCGIITIIIGALGGDETSDAAAVVERVAPASATDAAAAVTTPSAPGTEPESTSQNLATRAPEASPTPLPPTATPRPTNTPASTATPRPTTTPRSTATPVPPPEPVVYSGSGDDLVDLDSFTDGELFGISVTGSGSGNFALWSYDASGERIDLLINEIGAYEGRHLLNLNELEPATVGFEITANGPWTIEAFPFDTAFVTTHTAPGEFLGRGDDFFVVLNDAGINRATIRHTGSSNFAVWLLTQNGMDLLINEIGSYEGTVRTGSERVLLFIVTADGEWSITMASE